MELKILNRNEFGNKKYKKEEGITMEDEIGFSLWLPIVFHVFRKHKAFWNSFFLEKWVDYFNYSKII